MSDLTWRHTWDGGGPDYILLRARHPSIDPKPETVGRMMLFRPSGSNADAWKWSLTTQVRIAGFDKPGFATSGSEETEQGARDALIEAWRQEEAFRAEVRASSKFDELSSKMQSFIEHGQRTPARWVRDPGAT